MFHRRRTLAVRLVPAVAVLLALAGVVRPALATDPVDDPQGPTVTAPAGKEPPQQYRFWPYRQICTESALTGGQITTGGTAATVSVQGWIRPCAGQHTNDARYGLVYEVRGHLLVDLMKRYDSETGTTTIRFDAAVPAGVPADAAVPVCLVDYGQGDAFQQFVQPVACAVVTAGTGGRAAFTRVPTADPQVSRLRTIRNTPSPNGTQNPCGTCA